MGVDEKASEKWQLHWQFSDRTELKAQADLKSREETMAWIKDTQEKHPIPPGAKWLACTEKSEHFVKNLTAEKEGGSMEADEKEKLGSITMVITVGPAMTGFMIALAKMQKAPKDHKKFCSCEYCFARVRAESISQNALSELMMLMDDNGIRFRLAVEDVPDDVKDMFPRSGDINFLERKEEEE